MKNTTQPKHYTVTISFLKLSLLLTCRQNNAKFGNTVLDAFLVRSFTVWNVTATYQLWCLFCSYDTWVFCNSASLLHLSRFGKLQWLKLETWKLDNFAFKWLVNHPTDIYKSVRFMKNITYMYIVCIQNLVFCYLLFAEIHAFKFKMFSCCQRKSLVV